MLLGGGFQNQTVFIRLIKLFLFSLIMSNGSTISRTLILHRGSSLHPPPPSLARGAQACSLNKLSARLDAEEPIASAYRCCFSRVMFSCRAFQSPYLTCQANHYILCPHGLTPVSRTPSGGESGRT
jgi:hypothetical protein